MGKLYLIGGGLLLASAVFIGALLIRNAETQEKTPTTRGETNFGVFQAPQNIFESLRSNTESKPTTLTPQETPSTLNDDEQAERILALIRTWEQTATSSNAQTRAQPAVSVEESIATTRRKSEQAEVTDIFNDLLGGKITDVLDTATRNSSGGSTFGSGDVWLGGYNDMTSLSASQTSAPETQTQQALHAYGNALGKKLKAFLTAQGNQATLLEKFLKDRTNTRALESLTSAYRDLADDIATIEAPDLISTTHQGLVNSYSDVGGYLWRLTEAQTDKELVEKILEYNKTSEAVAKHHVSIVTLFKAHGIEFKSHEPGSIFTFSPPNNSGLSL